MRVNLRSKVLVHRPASPTRAISERKLNMLLHKLLQTQSQNDKNFNLLTDVEIVLIITNYVNTNKGSTRKSVFKLLQLANEACATWMLIELSIKGEVSISLDLQKDKLEFKPFERDKQKLAILEWISMQDDIMGNLEWIERDQV